MTDWSAREGGCRCDRLRFRISRPPVMTAACHCRGCQKMTSSAFSLSIAVPEEGFAILAGEPVVGGAQEMPGLTHSFCGHCMSWVFTRFPELMGPFVNVRSAMLDDPAGTEPFMETCTSEKLPWAATPARHSYAGFPAMEDFSDLLRDYAGQR